MDGESLSRLTKSSATGERERRRVQRPAHEDTAESPTPAEQPTGPCLLSHGRGRPPKCGRPRQLLRPVRLTKTSSAAHGQFAYAGLHSSQFRSNHSLAVSYRFKAQTATARCHNEPTLDHARAKK